MKHKWFWRLGAALLATGLAPQVSNAQQAGGAPPAPASGQPAPQLVFAFEETVELADAIPVGPTAQGIRNIVPITGGTFEGPGIKGTIIPGGWDWQLIRPNKCISIKADYMLKTDDSAVINVINAGTLCLPADGAKFTPGYTSPVFEAPLGKYGWLSQGAFVGTLEPVVGGAKPSVHIRFYRVQ